MSFVNQFRLGLARKVGTYAIYSLRHLFSLIVIAIFLSACGPANTPATDIENNETQALQLIPTFTATAVPTAIPTVEPSPTPLPLIVQPAIADTTAPALLQVKEFPGSNGHPTLVDLWEGRAEFVLDVPDTGLPMGESETIVMSNGEFWSYVHASDRSAGTIDRCGDPVEFPGCTVIYRSLDGGITFHHGGPPVCQFDCIQCPCVSWPDNVEQQQYPQVAYDGRTLHIAYEYQAKIMIRRSLDGLKWSEVSELLGSGIWHSWFQECETAEQIGIHPFVPYNFECLVGGPPGIHVDDNKLYVFMALGQNPSSMGCYMGDVNAPVNTMQKCQNNPLFTGVLTHGPEDDKGPATNAYFDFRTISSAEIQQIGDRYYMLYEGVRGPGAGDPGDTQFALGIARSLDNQIDSKWERYPDNPIIVDQPGNIGLGHSDLVVFKGQTLLYTSLDEVKRSRLVLVWK